MKTIKYYFGVILLLTTLLAACSKKISNDRIDKLESQESILKKTTELNDYKLELEKKMLRQSQLTKDVEDINRNVSSSSEDAGDMAGRVARNPGESGVANRSYKASKEAEKNAKTARKLNKDLDGVNSDIRKLERKVQKSENDLNELKSRVEFVPNTN